MPKVRLLAMAAVYAAQAFSQTNGSLQCTESTTTPPVVRAEGRSELVSDIVIECTGGTTGTLDFNFTVFLNVPVANRISNLATGLSDAVLVVDEGVPAPVLSSNLFQGTVLGNRIQFNGVPFKVPGPSATRVLRFTNLRAFVALAGGSTIESLVSASGVSWFPIYNSSQTLAIVQPGLSAAIRTPSDSSVTVFNSQQCVGQNSPLLSNPAAPASVNFNLKFSEGFASAFRKSTEANQQNVPGTVYNTETGYSPTGYPTLGAADSGTRLIARFTGVPAGVSLFVTTRPSPAGTSASMLNNAALTSTNADGSGAFSAIPHTGSVTINSSAIGIVQIPLTNGSGTAVWEILNSNPLALESVSFGVLVAYSNLTASLGAAQVRMTLGSVLDYSLPTATSPIPSFVDNTAPLIPFTVQACTPCNSLITPYAVLEDYPGASVGNTVAVTADPGCNWAASSDSGWITITEGLVGTGNGTVVYNLAQNSIPPRTGHLSIAGHTLTRSQRSSALTIANAASEVSQGFVAPGEIIRITGTNIGPPIMVRYALPVSSQSTAGFIVPTTLAKTRVLFDGVPSPMLFASSTYVEAMVPYAASSSTLIEVEYLGEKRDYIRTSVAPAAPGILPDVSNWDGSSNSTVPAAPGSVVRFFLNGVGQTNPAGIDGKTYYWWSDSRPVPVLPITAFVGGLPAQVVHASVASSDRGNWPVGITEVRLRIPPASLSGNRLLTLSVGGAAAQSGFFLNVSPTPCTYSLAAPSSAAPLVGGTFSLDLTTQGGCYWEATSNADWLTVTSGVSGTDSTTLTYAVAANTGAAQRIGTISIGGQTLAVTQAGTQTTQCLASPPTVWFDSVNYVSDINSASDRLIVGRMPFDKFASFSSIPVPTDLNQRVCGTIPIAPGYTAEAYVPTAAERLGDFSSFSGILLDPLNAYQPFAGGIIPQSRIPATMAWRVASISPCTTSVTLSGNDLSFPAGVVYAWVAVTASNRTCPWAATTNASWITFPNGSTGVGTAGLNFTAASNPTSLARTAQIMVGNQMINIYQEPLKTRVKIGIIRNGAWFLDSNGSGSFNNGVDRNFDWWGGAGTIPVTGDWNGGGTTKAGFYRDGLWYLDFDGNGVFKGADKVYGFGWAAAGIVPLVGDWNGDGRSKVAVFYNGFWYLDYNGNGTWDGPVTDRVYGWGWQGVTPLIGDWNGDGRTKIGFFINGFWYLDYNGNGLWEPALDRVYGWGWNGVTPVVADWNGDGRKKIGFFINGFWYLDYNGDGVWDNGVTDKVYNFGWNGITPLAGDWSGDGRDKIGIFINGTWYLDMIGTGQGGTAFAAGLGQAGDIPITGRW